MLLLRLFLCAVIWCPTSFAAVSGVPPEIQALADAADCPPVTLPLISSGYLPPHQTPVLSHERAITPASKPVTWSPGVAENGDVRGADNDGDGRAEPTHVNGYFRKNGTYVRSHYRALPRR